MTLKVSGQVIHVIQTGEGTAPEYDTTTIMLKEVVLVLALVVTRSNQQKCFGENDGTQFVPYKMLKAWIVSQHNFTVSLLKILNSERSGMDVVFSPACITESLLIAYFGATDKTEATLAKVLHVSDDQDKATTWRFYKNQKVAGIKDVNNPFPFEIANKMFLSDALNVRPCMKTKFVRELEQIDFRDKNPLHYINRWVEKKTRGHVKSLLTELSPNATATLVNAVYFKAKWAEEFETENSTMIPFRVSEYESRNIKMMRKIDYFDLAYFADIGARALLLPYRKNRIVLAYLLPDQDLDDMIVLLDAKALSLITNRRKYKSVLLDAFIPKISHSTKLDMVNVMKLLGIDNTFNRCGNYSGFTGKRDVFLDSMMHQSVVKVDELGTEGTESIHISNKMNLEDNRKPLTFILDRPFAYVIYDLVVKKTLFMGTFRDPEPLENSRKYQLFP